jgi:hypothetical protein
VLIRTASYGAFLVTMARTRYPDVFFGSFASSPVTMGFGNQSSNPYKYAYARMVIQIQPLFQILIPKKAPLRSRTVIMTPRLKRPSPSDQLWASSTNANRTARKAQRDLDQEHRLIVLQEPALRPYRTLVSVIRSRRQPKSRFSTRPYVLCTSTWCNTTSPLTMRLLPTHFSK